MLFGTGGGGRCGTSELVMQEVVGVRLGVPIVPEARGVRSILSRVDLCA